MVQKMQNIKRVRGHLNAVFCAIFDRSGRYVITGSDDRLVKTWSMETAYSLASCRGHEGDITNLAVSSNNALVAPSSNDYVIRVEGVAVNPQISCHRVIKCSNKMVIERNRFHHCNHNLHHQTNAQFHCSKKKSTN